MRGNRSSLEEIIVPTNEFSFVECERFSSELNVESVSQRLIQFTFCEATAKTQLKVGIRNLRPIISRPCLCALNTAQNTSKEQVRR